MPLLRYNFLSFIGGGLDGRIITIILPSLHRYERLGYIMNNESKASKIIRFILYSILKYFVLFIVDGSVYVFIELAFRGRSHISMFILGGFSGVIVGGLNNWYTWDMPLIKQMLTSTCIITCLEYITGYIVNIRMKLNVWDYSNIPFNLDGQICLLFSFFWIFISLIAIILDDLLRYVLFDEPYHKYRIV